ncbi:hypothetical protein [Thioalkalivibrio paradoxus]|nr:hypothetical protein [Thioalkalivibrio paradoxus]
MKTKQFSTLTAAVALALGLGATAWADDPVPPPLVDGANVQSEPVSGEGVTPYIIYSDRTGRANQGGNRSCADVASAWGVEPFQCVSNRNDYIEGLAEFEGEFELDEDASIPDPNAEEGDDAFAACRDVSFDVETDGTYLSFDASTNIGAVIVKGSAAANVYYYNPQLASDLGLAAPINASGGSAGLSNLTFCWNPDPDPPQEIGCWGGKETAWGAGDPYVEQQGNWAMYTSYEACYVGADLMAGQHYVAGEVKCDPMVDGTVDLKITMNEGWRFAPQWPEHLDACVADEHGKCLPAGENVKVQDYEDRPTGNPNPGGFEHKTTAEVDAPSVTLNVPYNNFYGIHVDVRRFGEEYCEVELD